MSTMFSLEKTRCKMGKYSNNTEFDGGGKDNPKFKRAWAFPFTKVLIPRELFNQLVDDPHADRSLFNINGDDIKTCKWLEAVTLSYPSKFIAEHVHVAIDGEQVLEFEKCQIAIPTLEPQRVGGAFAIELSIIFHPNDEQARLLDHNQHQMVWLTVMSAAQILKKKANQQEMQFAPNADAEKAGEEALANGNSGGEPDNTVTEAYLDTHVWWQNEAQEKSNGKRRDMPQGCVEIDPPKNSKSEAEQEAQQAANPDDTKEFAKAAESSIADFQSRKGRGKREGRRNGH